MAEAGRSLKPFYLLLGAIAVVGAVLIAVFGGGPAMPDAGGFVRLPELRRPALPPRRASPSAPTPPRSRSPSSPTSSARGARGSPSSRSRTSASG